MPGRGEELLLPVWKWGPVQIARAKDAGFPPLSSDRADPGGLGLAAAILSRCTNTVLWEAR